jgi:hypothetical protein
MKIGVPWSLTDLGNRSEARRGQSFTVFKRIVVPFAQESGELCTGQVILRSILPKSDRLLAAFR